MTDWMNCLLIAFCYYLPISISILLLFFSMTYWMMNLVIIPVSDWQIVPGPCPYSVVPITRFLG